MKEKALALLTCIFISLSILGFVYAQWNDVITISNTMTFGYWNESLNMGFVQPLTCTEYHTDPSTSKLVQGEYLGKHVGKCECQYTDPITGTEAYKTLVINITNAYPSYDVHCNFTVENIGTLPLHINETLISSPVLTWDPAQDALVDADGNPIITIVITPPLVCNELQPDNKAEFELSIHITQNAQECQTYSFQVKIMYEEA